MNTDISSGTIITFRIPVHLRHTALLGISVRALFSNLGFDDVEAYQLELAVIEAANNIIRYSRQPEGHQYVDMQFSRMAKKISCVFEDHGAATDYLQEYKKCAIGTDIQSLSESNRGIHIISNVMDEVTYNRIDHKNILTLVKYLP